MEKEILFKDDSASLSIQDSYTGLVQENCNSEISKYSLHVNEKKELVITTSPADWMISVTSHRLEFSDNSGLFKNEVSLYRDL